MKRLLLLLLVATPVFAQSPGAWYPVNSAQSGSCTPGPGAFNINTGLYYSCTGGTPGTVNSGTWTVGGGGGGGITGVTAGTGLTGGGTSGTVTLNVDTTKVAQQTTVSTLPSTSYSVVAVGDSRCAGSVLAGGTAWPAIVQTLAPFVTQSTGTTNKCVAGNTISNMISIYTSSGTKALCQAATTQNPVLLPAMVGVNDFAAGATSQAEYILYLQYMNQAKADGCTPIAITDLPAVLATPRSGYDLQRTQYNVLLRGCSKSAGAYGYSSCPWNYIVDLDDLHIDPADPVMMNGVITTVAISSVSGMTGYVNGDVLNIVSPGGVAGTCTVGGVSGGVPTTCTLLAGGAGYNQNFTNLTTTDSTTPAAAGVTVNIFTSYDQTHQSPQAQQVLACKFAETFGGTKCTWSNASGLHYPEIANTAGYLAGDPVAPNGRFWLNASGTSYAAISGTTQLFQSPGQFGVILGDTAGANSFLVYNSTPAQVASINSLGKITAGAATLSGALNFTYASAASSPQITSNCVPATGSTTTDFPCWWFPSAGATLPTFLTTGHYIGIQMPSGYTGDFLDMWTFTGGNRVKITAGGTAVFNGSMTASSYLTGANCSSSASPAVCAAAPDGSVTIAAAATTVTVNTTAVTANSQIFLQADDTLSTKLGVTCNSTLATLVGGLAVTARTAGTSFQISFNGVITSNPLCISYSIVN